MQEGRRSCLKKLPDMSRNYPTQEVDQEDKGVISSHIPLSSCPEVLVLNSEVLTLASLPCVFMSIKLLKLKKN